MHPQAALLLQRSIPRLLTWRCGWKSPWQQLTRLLSLQRQLQSKKMRKPPEQETEEIISAVGGVNLMEALRPPPVVPQKGRGRGKAKTLAAAASPKRKALRVSAPTRGSPAPKQVAKAKAAAATPSAVVKEELSGGSQRSRSPGASRGSTRESALADGTFDKLSAKAQENIDELLSLTKVLKGVSKLKSLVYQATRTQQALESIEYKAVDALNLKAHLDLVDLASKVSVPSLPKIDRNQRSDILAQLCPHVREFPTQWQIQWLAVYVRDLPINNQQSINVWLEAINPLCGPDAGAAC